MFLIWTLIIGLSVGTERNADNAGKDRGGHLDKKAWSAGSLIANTGASSSGVYDRAVSIGSSDVDLAARWSAHVFSIVFFFALASQPLTNAARAIFPLSKACAAMRN